MNEPISILKGSQSLNDDFIPIFGEDSYSVPTVIDYSALPEYSSRSKFADFEEDSESIFLSCGQTNHKSSAQKVHGFQMFDDFSDKQIDDRLDSRTLVNPISLEKSSLPTASNLTTQFEDFRFINTCNQLLKNPLYDSNFSNSLGAPVGSMLPDLDIMKKDMQVLEKTFGSKFFPQDDFDGKENYKQVIRITSFKILYRSH